MDFITEQLDLPTQEQIDNYLICKVKFSELKKAIKDVVEQYAKDKDEAKTKEDEIKVDKQYKDDKKALKEKFIREVNKNAFR